MSEPTSPSDATPAVPPAPSFTYGSPEQPPAPAAPPVVQPPAPAYGVPAYGTPVYGAPVAPKGRRTWDLVLTIILFVLGLFGMGIGLIYAAMFSDPALVQQIFDQAFQQQGLGPWRGSVGAAAAVIAISHIVLYLLAVGIGILLLVKRKVAFWVPLVAGVIAAIIFWASVMGVMFSDPTLMGQLR
jgi:hypothetical protein